MGANSQTIQSRLLDSWAANPAASALGFSRDGDSWQWWTREETDRRARAAAALLTDQGLAPGDTCALVLDSDATCSALLLGALLCAARPVLVAPPIVRGLHGNLDQVLQHVAERTTARVLVTQEAFGSLAEQVAQQTRGLSALVLGDSPPEIVAEPPSGQAVELPASDAVAAFQLTSGTTGFPRVCAWRQDRVLAAIDGMREAMQLTSHDRFVNWTPLYHDMGLVNNFLLCVTSGVPLAMLSAQAFVTRPAVWLRSLSNVRATTTWSPNFGFALATQRIADRELEGIDLSAVRGFWNAAERIHLHTMREFHRRFADVGVSWPALKTNFGCAENVGGATFSDPDGPSRSETVDASALHTEGVAVAVEDDHPSATDIVSAGRPHPQLEVVILDEQGEPCVEGQVGEVALDSPSRMIEYLGDPEATANAFHGELLKTGDLGYLRDGELFWVGRVRERITLHGKKYDPSDLEATLFGVPQLRPGCFAAFGVDDPEIGTQRLVVVSEVQRSDDPEVASLPGVVREAVVRDLGISVWDVVLLPRGSMSKTSSGKRRHRHYRRLYEDSELRPLASLRQPGDSRR